MAVAGCAFILLVIVALSKKSKLSIKKSSPVQAMEIGTTPVSQYAVQYTTKTKVKMDPKNGIRLMATRPFDSRGPSSAYSATDDLRSSYGRVTTSSYDSYSVFSTRESSTPRASSIPSLSSLGSFDSFTLSERTTTLDRNTTTSRNSLNDSVVLHFPMEGTEGFDSAFEI